VIASLAGCLDTCDCHRRLFLTCAFEGRNCTPEFLAFADRSNKNSSNVHLHGLGSTARALV